MDESSVDERKVTNTGSITPKQPFDNNSCGRDPMDDSTGAAMVAKTIACVHPVASVEEQPPEQQLSDSLSLLKDTLPGFNKSPPSPPVQQQKSPEEKEEEEEEREKSPSNEHCETTQHTSLANGDSKNNEIPGLELPDDRRAEDETSDSEIDEDALSIIIAVEGEDDDDDDMEIGASDKEQVLSPPNLANSQQLSETNTEKQEKTIDLTKSTSSCGTSEAERTDNNANKVSSPVVGETADSAPKTATAAASSKDDSSTQHSKQSAKVKQFFTTLQTFGNRTSQEVADQVQELITALVNDLVTVEEFHQEIQKVTNHPLKDFVVPFLKDNLTYFRNELKSTSLVLTDVLGTSPKSTAPAVAPEISEPDLIVIPSTKPSAPPTTSTVITTPSSPLRAPANLTSMSVPPATIHEPQLISPTKIESVINASVVSSNSRKRPRDLIMGNGSDERDTSIVQRVPKRPRPIPTATLTPEPLQPPPPPPVSRIPSPVRHTPSYSHPHASSAHHTPSTPHTPHNPSTGHHVSYHKSMQATTPQLHPHPHPHSEVPTGVAMVSLSGNQRLAIVNQVKEDWNHLETMLVSVEGMVVKTQKALSSLKERIQQIGLGPSPAQMKAYEEEIEQKFEQKFKQRMEKAVEEIQHQSAEEKQRILLDATKQLRDTVRDMNTQSNSKESCWNCGRKATETCSGCNKARYCGTYCQHKDWDRHMKQCAGARPSPTGIRVEKERAPVQIAAISHNHAPLKPSSHYITGPHPSHTPSGVSYRRTTSSRTPTPTTSYVAASDIYVPLHTSDTMSNGGSSNSLTSTSTGVAVVTINRTPGDLHPGINMV